PTNPGAATPNPTQNYLALAADLNSLKSDELAFLTTVGTPAYAGSNGMFDVANTSAPAENLYAYYQQFGLALESLGGTPGTTLALYSEGSAYTLISCLSCGDSLTGHAVLSSTAFSQQGQTGFVHGTLQRESHGWYWPAKTSQETQAEYAGGTGADY